MKKWSVLIILCAAQFVMVLDSTVMNVSISEVVADLGTTVTGLQAAITLYTLTMAALMLTGGKLGDIWGRLPAFKIGSVIYGIGSLITAFSPSLGVLLIGWSVIEGLGAVLVIPAIAALAAANYQGKERAVAFAAIGGISGMAAAAGPLIGGFVTTYLSWRYVFAAETIIMAVLLFSIRFVEVKSSKAKTSIDVPSVMLSAFGMSALVFGMLQSKTWGWVQPLGAPTINGNEITPLGISVVAYLLLLGVILLWLFYRRQQMLEDTRKNPLVKMSLLRITQLRSGLMVLLSQYTIIAATFFIIPIYLQILLGFDALTTGIKILPLSFAVIIFSVVGTRLTNRYSLRRIVRIGQVTLIAGAAILLASINPDLKGFNFGLGMFVLGAGLGFLASQLGNINMSAVSQKDSSEVGGLQGTFQNLGSSFGTALVGSVFIASLTAGLVQSVNSNPDLPSSVKTAVQQSVQAGAPVISAPQVKALATEKGLPQGQADALASSYKDAQIDGLREGVFFIVILAVISLPLARFIPNSKKA